MSKILLKDRLEFLYGFSVRVSNETTGKYPVFGSNGITGYIDSYKVEAPGIIIGRKGTFGAINFSKKNFTPTDTAYYVSLKDKAQDDIKFWFYYLRVLGLNKLNTHSSVPGLSREIAYFLNINPPDLSSQQKIAAVLSALDAKIEINNRINAELEAMAKTLYDYWFVHNDKTRKWEIARLGDFVKVNERSITKDYPYDKIEYIDISSVSLGRLEGTTAYPLKDSPSRARRLVQHGDTIWSTVRPNRKSYLFISNPKENLVVSTGFAVLTPKKIPPSFLYFLTTTEQFVNYLVSNAEGSAYPAVSAERFSDAAFSIPPENLLMEFESIASPALTQIAHNGKENQTLATLRDWLLPLLMNGQASVE